MELVVRMELVVHMELAVRMELVVHMELVVRMELVVGTVDSVDSQPEGCLYPHCELVVDHILRSFSETWWEQYFQMFLCNFGPGFHVSLDMTYVNSH